MDTKLVIIGNLKGGAGKSTVTNFLAMYIYKYTNLSVIVVDGDDDQQTIMNWRNKDELRHAKAAGVDTTAKGWKNQKGWKEQWKTIKKYDLASIPSKDFAKQYIDVINGNYDICLFDVPGNMRQEGVEKSFYMADAIIVPSKTTDADINSTMRYLKYLRDDLLPSIKHMKRNPSIYYFLNIVRKNMVRVREMMEQKDVLYGFEQLNGYIPDMPKGAGEDVSTVDFEFMGEAFNKYISPLAEEIIEIVKNVKHG